MLLTVVPSIIIIAKMKNFLPDCGTTNLLHSESTRKDTATKENTLIPITPKEKKSTTKPAKIALNRAELKLVFAVQIIINIKTKSGVILFGKKFGKKDVCAMADKKIIIFIKIFCIIIFL